MRDRLARVVTEDPQAPLVRSVVEVLTRAAVRVKLTDASFADADGLFVLLDDAALPQALYRFISLLPGRAVFPNVVLVLEKPENAGGLLAEGFRDIVAPADLPRAIENLVGGLPPVLLTQLRREIEKVFLPDYAMLMRSQAREKHRLLAACVDLVRAVVYLERRIHRLQKITHRQTVAELLVAQARIEGYQSAIEGGSLRLHRMPPFPEVSSRSRGGRGGLGRREPRVKRSRELLEETVEGLRQTGLLAGLSGQADDQLASAVVTFRTEPLAGLREVLKIIEGDITAKLTAIEDMRADLEPVAALEKRCLDRYGFSILPPGIVVPNYVRMIIQSLAQPPAEIYLTWAIDLRDLRFRLCSEVLADIARGLAERGGGPTVATLLTIRFT